MSKKVVWTEQARADVRSIDRQLAMKLLTGIDRFAATEHGDVKQLVAVDPPQMRLRLGDYRIHYRLVGDAMQILAVKHRREAYR